MSNVDEIIDETIDWFKQNWRNYIFTDGDGETGFMFWQNDYRNYIKDKFNE